MVCADPCILRQSQGMFDNNPTGKYVGQFGMRGFTCREKEGWNEVVYILTLPDWEAWHASLNVRTTGQLRVL